MALLGVVSLAICKTFVPCNSKALCSSFRESGGTLKGREGPLLYVRAFSSFVWLLNVLTEWGV